MAKHRLTDLSVKSLPVGKYFDALTPAFGVRVGKSRRTWIVMRGRNRQLIRVGHYPDLSLAEARQKAKQLLAATQLNNERISFKDAYDLFDKTHIPHLRVRTQADYRRTLKRHYLPTLSNKRLDAITSYMVLAITDELVDTPSELSHALAVGKTFFKWALRRHYISRSPLEGAILPKTASRTRVLNDAELKTVWTAAGTMPGNFGVIVKLLILTGQRRGEVAALQTSWIQDETITIPAEVTKNARQHQFPIGSMTATILRAAISKSPSAGLLFPARIATATGEQFFTGWSQSKKNLDKLLNVAPWTLHDLRRTFATNLADLGVAPHVIERLLNHVTGTISGVAAIYNRSRYEPEMKAAMELWEHRLHELLQ